MFRDSCSDFFRSLRKVVVSQTASRSENDYFGNPHLVHSLSVLSQCICSTRQQLADVTWRSHSRKTVRSMDQTYANQILLGMYSGNQSSGRLQYTKNTYRFPGLTRLILRTLQNCPQFAEMVGTSIQINKNVRTIPHRDASNRIRWGVGQWHGGGLFIQDAHGVSLSFLP